MEYLIHFFKEVSGLDTKEKRKPQKGKFRTRQVKTNTDWEVQTAGSTAGEQVRIKRITKESAMRLSDLGMTQDQMDQLEGFRQGGQGLFLVTGPKKSGITTTMYAMIRDHQPYTLCTLIGGVIFLGLHQLAVSPHLSSLVGICSISGLRLLAVTYQWQIPSWPRNS